MPAARVLIVCAQNICRSPYLAISLAARLERDGADGLFLSSRGASAAAGHRMCSIAAASLSGDGAERATHHRSRRLAVGDLQRAGLILTASTTERAAAALLLPEARSKLFTVREALMLGQAWRGWHESVGDAEDAPSRLERVAAALHRQRVSARIPTAALRRGMFGSHRRPTSPLDIPDKHTGGPSAHRKLFPSLDEDVGGLAELLSPVLERNQGVIGSDSV